MNNSSPRNVGFDQLRIFSCFLIIMLHTSGYLDLSSELWKYTQTIVRPALWTFMALSGYFILSADIKKWGDFYLSRMSKLLIGLIIYSFIYQIYFAKGLKLSIKSILAGDNYGHMWYVYSLFIIYMIAPLLHIIVNNISQKQLTILLVVMYIWGRIIPLLSLYGFEFGFTDPLLKNSSIFYFLLGYWIKQTIKKITKKKMFLLLFVIEILNILITEKLYTHPILSQGIDIMSLSMILSVIIYFLFFNNIAVNKLTHKKMIQFISARTYGIYLIHILILKILVNNGLITFRANTYYNAIILMIYALVIFSISLIVSCFLDLLICKPILNLEFRIIEIIKTKQLTRGLRLHHKNIID